MPLTFVPGVESRTENKHDLKSGQGDGIGDWWPGEGEVLALHLPCLLYGTPGGTQDSTIQDPWSMCSCPLLPLVPPGSQSWGFSPVVALCWVLSQSL